MTSGEGSLYCNGPSSSRTPHHSHAPNGNALSQVWYVRDSDCAKDRTGAWTRRHSFVCRAHSLLSHQTPFGFCKRCGRRTDCKSNVSQIERIANRTYWLPLLPAPMKVTCARTSSNRAAVCACMRRIIGVAPWGARVAPVSLGIFGSAPRAVSCFSARPDGPTQSLVFRHVFCPPFTPSCSHIVTATYAGT